MKKKIISIALVSTILLNAIVAPSLADGCCCCPDYSAVLGRIDSNTLNTYRETEKINDKIGYTSDGSTLNQNVETMRDLALTEAKNNNVRVDYPTIININSKGPYQPLLSEIPWIGDIIVLKNANPSTSDDWVDLSSDAYLSINNLETRPAFSGTKYVPTEQLNRMPVIGANTDFWDSFYALEGTKYPVKIDITSVNSSIGNSLVAGNINKQQAESGGHTLVKTWTGKAYLGDNILSRMPSVAKRETGVLGEDIYIRDMIPITKYEEGAYKVGVAWSEIGETPTLEEVAQLLFKSLGKPSYRIYIKRITDKFQGPTIGEVDGSQRYWGSFFRSNENTSTSTLFEKLPPGVKLEPNSYLATFVSNTNPRLYLSKAIASSIIPSTYIIGGSSIDGSMQNLTDKDLETIMIRKGDSYKSALEEINKPITVGDFAVILKNALRTFGEGELSIEETNMIVAGQGSLIPSNLPMQQLEAAQYLFARGILYEQVDFNSIVDKEFILRTLMRAKDTKSRMDFKKVLLPYNPEMIKRGYTPIYTENKTVEQVDIISNAKQGGIYTSIHKDLLKFYDKKGEQIDYSKLLIYKSATQMDLNNADFGYPVKEQEDKNYIKFFIPDKLLFGQGATPFVIKAIGDNPYPREVLISGSDIIENKIATNNKYIFSKNAVKEVTNNIASGVPFYYDGSASYSRGNNLLASGGFIYPKPGYKPITFSDAKLGRGNNHIDYLKYQESGGSVSLDWNTTDVVKGEVDNLRLAARIEAQAFYNRVELTTPSILDYKNIGGLKAKADKFTATQLLSDTLVATIKAKSVTVLPAGKEKLNVMKEGDVFKVFSKGEADMTLANVKSLLSIEGLSEGKPGNMIVYTKGDTAYVDSGYLKDMRLVDTFKEDNDKLYLGFNEDLKNSRAGALNGVLSNKDKYSFLGNTLTLLGDSEVAYVKITQGTFGINYKIVKGFDTDSLISVNNNTVTITSVVNSNGSDVTENNAEREIKANTFNFKAPAGLAFSFGTETADLNGKLNLANGTLFSNWVITTDYSNESVQQKLIAITPKTLDKELQDFSSKNIRNAEYSIESDSEEIIKLLRMKVFNKDKYTLYSINVNTEKGVDKLFLRDGDKLYFNPKSSIATAKGAHPLNIGVQGNTVSTYAQGEYNNTKFVPDMIAIGSGLDDRVEVDKTKTIADLYKDLTGKDGKNIKIFIGVKQYDLRPSSEASNNFELHEVTGGN